MSSVRLRIVINSNNTWDELVALRRVWEELSARMRGALAAFSQHARAAFCGLRGHDDRLLAERNHLALSCGRCGRVTSGWDLPESSRSYASPSRHHATAPGPRYFQMARRS
jgi:hypothetical protein